MCHIFFFNLADGQKVMACILHDCHSFHAVWLKLGQNCGSGSLLEILTSEILQSAPVRMTTQRIGHEKYPTYAVQYCKSDHESQTYVLVFILTAYDWSNDYALVDHLGGDLTGLL